MRVALDATYSVDSHPSGIAIYSRLLLTQLPRAFPQEQFVQCFRFRQWRHVFNKEPAVRLLLPPLPTFRADLFHGLNQRVDRRPSRTVVTTFHDLFVMTGEYSTPEFRKRFTQQARAAAENSDLIIAVSQFTAKQVTDLLHIEPERIRVVHHGVRTPDIVSEPDNKKPLILFVGTLQTRKNVVRLVEAFENVPAPWRLVLAGAKTGFGASEAIQRIEGSPCRDRIDLPGYVSEKELRALYAQASVFAFPSLDEGFGIPILEAMSAGVPVLTSNSSALVEIAGDAALLVDASDIHSIASGLRRMTCDESLREELTERGRLRALHFSEKRTVEGTYQVYREAQGLR